MAKFTFTIESDEMGEMSSLLGKLFAGSSTGQPAIAVNKSPLTHPDDEPEEEALDETPVHQPEEVVRRKRRTRAEIEADRLAEEGAKDTLERAPADEPVKEAFKPEPEPEVEEADDDDDMPDEVTIDMVRALGSKAMGVIKASGVSAIFKTHGGGAETFGSLQPANYAAVYRALLDATK